MVEPITINHHFSQFSIDGLVGAIISGNPEDKTKHVNNLNEVIDVYKQLLENQKNAAKGAIATEANRHKKMILEPVLKSQYEDLPAHWRLAYRHVELPDYECNRVVHETRHTLSQIALALRQKINNALTSYINENQEKINFYLNEGSFLLPSVKMGHPLLKFNINFSAATNDANKLTGDNWITYMVHSFGHPSLLRVCSEGIGSEPGPYLRLFNNIRTLDDIHDRFTKVDEWKNYNYQGIDTSSYDSSRILKLVNTAPDELKKEYIQELQENLTTMKGHLKDISPNPVSEQELIASVKDIYAAYQDNTNDRRPRIQIHVSFEEYLKHLFSMHLYHCVNDSFCGLGDKRNEIIHRIRTTMEMCAKPTNYVCISLRL